MSYTDYSVQRRLKSNAPIVRCVRLDAALRRMTSKYRIPMLSNRSRDTLMSYTDHSAQLRFKSNTPYM